MLALQRLIPNAELVSEPPYTERYVRWCERTVRELIPHFLLAKKEPKTHPTI
jgi:hypothetical protein